MALRTWAVIPARAGSKGLPGKNVRLFHGRPLLAWSVRVARESGLAERIIVSTDDPATAELGRAAGAEVPGLRPVELAGDTTPMLEVLLDLLTRLSPEPEAVLLLQPTSPLRTVADVQGAVDLLENSGADAVVSVTLSKQHPQLLQRIGPGQRVTPYLPEPAATRRQDFPPLHVLNGAIFLVRPEALRQERTFLPAQTFAWEMPPERAVDIDTELDWRLAELLFKPC